MVAELNTPGRPFGLVVSGEAETWLPAVEQIVGPGRLVPYRVRTDGELLNVIETGAADAAVLDDRAEWQLDVLQLLRMIRRMNAILPVVVITGPRDRRWMESALRLAAFSVVRRPLELEQLLRQIHRMMDRLERAMRGEDVE